MKKPVCLLVLVGVICLGLLPSLVASVNTPIVRAPSGSFIGFNANSTSHFLGIRYGRASRFKAAVMENSPDEVVEAKAYGPVCWQRKTKELREVPMSEDCLMLNIWAPESKIAEVGLHTGNPKLLPVVVWIHGGAYVVGAGSNPVVSGVGLTSQNAILVTINYRLGLFGFWRHADLRAEGESVHTNFGLYDQQLALEWIQKNIAAFGGDPNSVTVFGESAGASSILHHITSKRMIDDAALGKPKLFHRAWISSAVLLEQKYLKNPEAEVIGHHWATQKGCKEFTVACMKKLDPTILIEGDVARWSAFDHDTNREMVFTVEDDNFPLISVALREGQFDHEIPMVFGSAMEDASLFTWFSFPLYGPEKEYMKIIIHESFGEQLGEIILNKYPSEKYPSEYWRLTDILSDVVWHCPASNMADIFANNIKSPVRRYVFNYRFNDSADLFGIFHASELTTFFENPSGNYLFPTYFTEEERLFARSVAQLLIQFATDSIDSNIWPSYSTDSQDYLLLGDARNTRIAKDSKFRTDICSFWQASIPRGLEQLPKDLFAKEGITSRILNNAFWKIARYEALMTKRNGYIAIAATLGVTALLALSVSSLLKRK